MTIDKDAAFDAACAAKELTNKCQNDVASTKVDMHYACTSYFFIFIDKFCLFCKVGLTKFQALYRGHSTRKRMGIQIRKDVKEKIPIVIDNQDIIIDLPDNYKEIEVGPSDANMLEGCSPRDGARGKNNKYFDKP